MRYTKEILLALIPASVVLLAMSISAHALTMANAIVLDPKNLGGQLIGKKLEYLIDENKKVTIDNIATPDIETMFKQGTDDTLNFGNIRKDIWVKLTVDNPGKTDYEWILEYSHAFMDIIDLYIPDAKGVYKVKRHFLAQLKNRKMDIKHPYPMFKIQQRPGLSTLYIHFYTRGECIIPLKMWTPTALIENVSDLFSFVSLFYGIMVVMLLYNIFIFASVREREYFFYLINLIAFIFLYLCMDGFGFNYLWGNLPSQFTDTFLGIAIFLSHATSLLFSRSYLQTARRTPWLDKVVLFLLAVELIVAIYLFFDVGIAVFIQVLLGLIEMLFLTFILSLRHLFMGSRMARFYVLSYWCLLAGWIFRTMGSLGSMESNIFTMWGPQIGTMVMMLLFSLGLADKINTMKNELADLNKNLEQKVADRTMELRSAMEELEAMNENLQTTMDELEQTNEKLVQTRDALWGEMQLAKKIQTVLLPVEPKMKGFDIAAYMETADEVGGDYYDLIHEGGKDWIVIGDVSGHGVPAGLVMMMVQTAIHTALSNSNHGDLSPARLLININKTITENIRRLGETKYMTITVFACIDGGIFHFAGLHQDIMIYRAAKKSVEMIATDGMWIGIFDELTDMVTDNQFSMDSGDAVLLYTDGITEARDSSDAMYGEDRLVKLFEQHATSAPEQIKDAVISSLQEYKKADDISLMIFKKL